MMLSHAIHSRSRCIYGKECPLPACLQFVFARRVLLGCLLMVAALAGARSSQATVASSKSHHRIHLRWNAPPQSSVPVAGYNIYRSDDGGKTFRKVNGLPVAKTEYNDRLVRRGLTYIYLVKSVGNKGGESGPSNEIRLRVP